MNFGRTVDLKLCRNEWRRPLIRCRVYKKYIKCYIKGFATINS